MQFRRYKVSGLIWLTQRSPSRGAAAAAAFSHLDLTISIFPQPLSLPSKSAYAKDLNSVVTFSTFSLGVQMRGQLARPNIS